jgi:site-specific DNA-cytosine methylase
MKKIILDLCGGTGSWSRPYKDVGYEVYNITLPDYNIFDVYVGEKRVNFNTIQSIELSSVYGILAAPPCTMFSLARTRAIKPRNFDEGMAIVKKCMNIIWEIRKDHKLTFWALENPMGYLRQFLGKPILTFNPCDYGDAYTKKTDLWGYYNLPTKHPVEPVWVWDSKHRVRMSPNHFHSSGNTAKGKEFRSITPPGFANAFYKANQ